MVFELFSEVMEEVEIYHKKEKDFDHGVRGLCSELSEAELVVLFTKDALPSNKTFLKIS